MKILIVGHAQHGKDTVADLLCMFSNYSASSSSKFVMFKMQDKIMEDLNYSSFEECYSKRGLNRTYLYNLIRDYNTPDKSRLSRELLFKHDIYVGMRDLEEYNSSRHLYDLKIWVDSSLRGIAEESVESFNIPRDSFDIVIENSGSYDELVDKVVNLSRSLRR